MSPYRRYPNPKDKYSPQQPTQHIKKTVSQAILEHLASQNRRVLSSWRAVISLRRATEEIPASERRWSSSPTTVDDVKPYLPQMVARGELRPLFDIPNLYEVTVPYARNSPVQEDEILMEAHPFAALSHLSALVYHGLTNELPKHLLAIVPAEPMAGMLPLGTDSRDWEGLVIVRGRPLRHIGDRPVEWVHANAARFFGMGEYCPHGYPVRVTTPERTLLDGLQQPQLSGGFENVLRAWVLAKDTLDIDLLVSYVDRFDVGVLRQRVGFIMDELNLVHPMIAKWQSMAVRGGSSKLLGSAPYAPTFSERWNLSINAPTAALHES